MVVKMKYSNIKPEWNWGGYLPHIDDFDKVFNNEKEFTCKYNPFSRTLEVFLSQEDAININLILSQNDLDFGTKIFYKSRIDKFTQPEYKITFYEDVKYSIYYLLSQTNHNDVKIWTTRNQDLNIHNLMYKDNLMDINLPINTKLSFPESQPYKTDWNGYAKVYLFKGTKDGKSYGIGYKYDSTGRNYSKKNPVLSFVFTQQWKQDERTSFTVLPVLDDGYDVIQDNIWFLQIQNGSILSQIQIKNTWRDIDYIYRRKFANNLLGVFWNPYIFNLEAKYFKLVTYDTDNTKYLLFDIDEKGIDIDYEIPLKRMNTTYENDPYSFNKQIYILNNMDLFLYGRNIRNKGLVSVSRYDRRDIIIKIYGKLSFGSAFTYNLRAVDFVQAQDYRQDLTIPQNLIIQLPQYINFLTDQYAKYIQANYNQLNTSLQIAQQNAIIGGAGSLINGIINTAQAIGGNLSKAPQAIGNFLSLGQDILSYNQQKNKISAMLSDRQNSITNILNSNDESNGLLLYYDNGFGDIVVKQELVEETNTRLEQIINYNGFYNPKFYSFKNINDSANNKNVCIEFESYDLHLKLANILNSNFNENNIILNNNYIENIIDKIGILRIKQKNSV